MLEYTVRLYDEKGDLAAIAVMSAESDLPVYVATKEKLRLEGAFLSAEILRDGVLLKTIIG